MDDHKNRLIGEILEIELKMFLSVPVLEKASCQEHPEDLQTIRRAQFLTWSEQTLESYLHDLMTAEHEGQNLMTQKYARMDNLIPRQNEDPLIEKVVTIQYAWQKEMFLKYPHLMHGARPLGSSEDSAFQTSFETYLCSELETYSHETLVCLHDDISRREKEAKNMTEELYEYMVRGLGYESLDQAEETAEKRRRAR